MDFDKFTVFPRFKGLGGGWKVLILSQVQFGALAQNVDECLDPRKNLCPGECINVPGSFYCNCSIPGYEPSHTDKFCNDVDECTQNNGDCQEHCKNTLGSYECSCRKGLVLTKDLHNCTDINECEEYGPHICKNGDCINRYGVYQCMCYHGYQQHKDGIHCTDLNECMHNNGGCQDVCVNTIGSYHCDCSWPGYKITARTECTDIDECSSDNGGCQDVCVNTYGAFYCLCNQPGFVVHVNGRNCSICQTHEYIDEEKKVCVDCPQNSSVLNYTASSVADCFCNSGYHGNPAQNIPCQDIDECEQNLLNCSEGCQNIPGSAFCTCPDGFYLKEDGMNCNDTDECRFKQGGCQGECHNTVGSYYCTCFQGYQLDSDNHTCLDLDECWLNGHNCSHHCTNHDGWAECSCFKGYRLQADQKSCQDINECEEFGNVFCEDTCVNTEGSYKCLCTDKGYKLSWDGASCSDINECMEGENNCQDVCINMLGSFKCDCNQVGFALSADGHTCLDIDECQSPETNKCEHTCVNLPGTFMCQCNPGYVRAGHFHCEACSVGYYSNYSAPLCKRCPLLSTTKTKASVSIADCHCMEGFYGNLAAGEQCSDINECEGDDNFGCEHNCYNTHGSANCGCQDGYKLHENGKNCTDIDECVFSHHYCIDKCINLPGTYKCGCREGFVIRYDGRYCNDVNECAFDNPCEDWCENTWGSYTCECRHPGQKVAPDGISCIDSVEKIQCPKDVFVEIRHEKNFAVVTLPSMISSDHVKVTPEWVKSGAAFPVGTTVITLTSVHDLIPNNTCVFNVHILQICGEGTYKASNSTRFETICLKCPVGTYQNEQGQTECKNCFVGTFQNETGQHQCKYCMPGTFQNSTKQAACIPCQAGTYQDESGQHRCKSCHMGTYNRRMRESACYYCSAGTFQDEYGQSECKPCIPGMYQDDLGQTWCKQCPSDPSLYPYNEEITKQCPSVVQ